MKIFKPTLILKNVNEIDIQYILNNGYKLVVFDMNNTITDYYTTHITNETKELITKLKDTDITIYILTNSFNENHAKKVANTLNVKYIHKAFKPLPFAISKILKKENIQPNKAIMVGDHIFTDILNANLCKIDSILVEPLNKKEKLHSKLTRKIENIFIQKYIPKK